MFSDKESKKMAEQAQLLLKLPALEKVIITLLIEKGLVTQAEFRAKAIELSGMSEAEFDKTLQKLSED